MSKPVDNKPSLASEKHVSQEDWAKVEQREKARRLRGRCSYCGILGHTVRTCPTFLKQAYR